MTQPAMGDRRIRSAAPLVATGLIVQACSLLWTGPSAFLVFMLLGASCTGVGMIMAARLIWKRAGNVREGE